jgi:ACS family hexuronate transporter-like MFS transporter
MSGAPARLREPKATATRTVAHLRWYICGLLFFATTVNYVDRQVLGILKPVLSRELGWNDADFGWIVFAFQGAYALMMPLAGRLIDRLGTRIGYALAVIVWSLAAASHSIARSTLQFAAARFGLGLGEAANFPAAIRTVADWFPANERALATGIFNSGTNVGAVVAPLLVPFVAAHFGWRYSFLAGASLDLVWVAVWLSFYHGPKEHPLLSSAELSLIEAGRENEAPASQIRYPKLLTKRAAWAFIAGKFLTDPVWWFYLFWLPSFLNRKYGLDLTQLGLPLMTIYLLADFGSIGGGWMSSRLLSLGWQPNRARKTAMLICAMSALAVVLTQYMEGHEWLAVALLGIATAAHQGWSANLFTLPSDLFPRAAVGSVVGIGGFAGAIGGMLAAPVIGYWLDFSHGAYGPLFFVAGSMYLVALMIIHLLVPRIEQVAI